MAKESRGSGGGGGCAASLALDGHHYDRAGSHCWPASCSHTQWPQSARSLETFALSFQPACSAATFARLTSGHTGRLAARPAKGRPSGADLNRTSRRQRSPVLCAVHSAPLPSGGSCKLDSLASLARWRVAPAVRYLIAYLAARRLDNKCRLPSASRFNAPESPLARSDDCVSWPAPIVADKPKCSCQLDEAAE